MAEGTSLQSIRTQTGSLRYGLFNKVPAVWRRAKGLSLREIAKNASISYGTVSNIINGKGTYAR